MGRKESSMKTRASKKSLIFFLAILTSILLMTGSVYAGRYSEALYTDNLVVRIPEWDRFVYLPAMKGYKNLKATCSNDKIHVEAFPEIIGTGYPYVDISFYNSKNKSYLTAGKGTVTVTGKKNGKKKTLKFNVKVEKGSLIHPFKSFKIGSTELKKKFDLKKGFWNIGFNGTMTEVDGRDVYIPNKMLKRISGKKLDIRLKKGWKVLKIREDIMKYDNSGTAYSTKSYTIKNGMLRRLNLPKGDTSYSVMGVEIKVWVVNTKTNLQELFSVYLN